MQAGEASCHVRADWRIAAGAVRPAAARPDQRRVLRAAVAGAGGDLRPDERHQLHARRPVHDGRVLRLDAARTTSAFPFGAPGAGADHRRHHRHHHRAAVHLAAVPSRSPVRPAADLRAGADHRGPVPPAVRLLGPALHQPIPGRHQPRLHVPALVSRVHRRLLAGRVPRHLVHDREDQARLLPARRHRAARPGAGVRHQRAAHDHADLRLRRRPRRRWPACWRRRSTRSTR